METRVRKNLTHFYNIFNEAGEFLDFLGFSKIFGNFLVGSYTRKFRKKML